VWIAAIAAFCFTLLVAYVGGRKSAANKVVKKELQAHGRINEADTGIGATDAERIERLQRMGKQWDSN
jgi:hypothetical protein